jgi:FHS family glucose/mannose:H+ symporter-like MFS transporter
MSETPAIQPNTSGNHFILLLLIHGGFVLIGIVTTLLGVIMPALSARLNLNDAQSGTLFTAQFAGSLFGTLISGFLWKRFGFLIVLFAGLTLMTVGILGLGWVNRQTVAPCIFLSGIGIGLTIPTSNLLVAALNPDRQAAALNILNFAWGGGALLSPTFFGLLGTQQDIRLPIGFLSGSLLLTALCFLLFSFVPLTSAHSDTPNLQTNSTKIWRTPFAVLTAVLLFFYVGTESSLSGWISAYSLRLAAAEATLWTPATFAFWTAFLLGRLFAPLGLRRVNASVYVLFSLLIAALGMFFLLATTQIIFVIIGVILVGLGLAPVFPTVLAEFTGHFGESGARAANWLFIGSTFGGASLTWSVGFLSNAFGSLRIGFIVIFFCCLLMIALQAYLCFEAEDKMRFFK